MANPNPSGEGATPNPDPGATPNPVTGATPAAMTLDQALAKLTELTHANQNATEERDRHRKKLDAYEKEKADAEKAKLSDIERITKERDEATAALTQQQRELQEARVGNTIALLASKLNIVDADAATRLMDWSEIEYDSDGKPTNIEKLLKALVEAKPYLIAQTTTPRAPAQPSMNGARNQRVQPQRSMQEAYQSRDLGAIWRKDNQ